MKMQVVYNLGVLKQFKLKNQTRKVVKIYRDYEL